MGAPCESPMGSGCQKLSGHRSQRARRLGILSRARMGLVLALPWLHTTAPYDQPWQRTVGREQAGGGGVGGDTWAGAELGRFAERRRESGTSWAFTPQRAAPE